ncbi:hypothetical protein IVA88_12920 [Bradyrhizobium sp. 149]|uniref:hypothetical protein n=1 Tax=Bradyrhizobium sp. 149 TaxID=2782624 RepID=UPI001FF93AC4|nr:hypothetical protein [Bradyrhizobium sp. 149]MCK1652332.1 hypothetical protein [Bradyrhizobium sp. 149]
MTMLMQLSADALGAFAQPDQPDWLRAEASNEVQGFLFSAARSAAEIPKLLADFGQRASRAA